MPLSHARRPASLSLKSFLGNSRGRGFHGDDGGGGGSGGRNGIFVRRRS